MELIILHRLNSLSKRTRPKELEKPDTPSVDRNEGKDGNLISTCVPWRKHSSVSPLSGLHTTPGIPLAKTESQRLSNYTNVQSALAVILSQECTGSVLLWANVLGDPLEGDSTEN